MTSNDGQTDLLIVGEGSHTGVGGSFLRAAGRLGLRAELVDSRQAFAGHWLVRKVLWHACGHRPVALASFGDAVVERCEAVRPRVLLATGHAPLTAAHLARVAALGTRTACFLTDDPWSPLLRSTWFLKALPGYSVVFSPRRASLPELAAAGCRDVSYLAFGWDRDLFPVPDPDVPLSCKGHDVVFVGTADGDRVPFIERVVREGFDLGLYGQYWERWRSTRRIGRPALNVAATAATLGAAKVAICLVRRVNRDGHCMRTFEVPPLGTCMVAEDTAEHRDLFGPDGVAVRYFATPEDLVVVLRAALADETARRRMARAAQAVVVGGGHSYEERLKAALAHLTSGSVPAGAVPRALSPSRTNSR